MTQLALLLQRTGMPAAFDGILMAACATFMEGLARLGCFCILVRMALMAWLDHLIFRQHLMMAGFTFGDRQARMFLMRKRHYANLCLELDNFLVIRNLKLT